MQLLAVAADFSAGRFVCCVCCVLLLFPFLAVGDVLGHYRDRFIAEMDASTVVWELADKGIIDSGDLAQITMTFNATVQNQILHACLKRKCTRDAFHTACNIIINVPGNPAMNALGRDMQKKLQTGK